MNFWSLAITVASLFATTVFCDSEPTLEQLDKMWLGVISKEVPTVDKLECVLRVSEDSAKRHNWEELWSNNEAKLKEHLESLKQCPNAEVQWKCELIENLRFFRVFFKLSIALDDNVGDELRKIVKETCNYP